jgi:hypothetical protein
MKRATLAQDNRKQIQGEKKKERRWFNLSMARAEKHANCRGGPGKMSGCLMF